MIARLTLAAVLAVSLAACGTEAEDETSGSDEGPPTRSAYIVQTDRICAPARVRTATAESALSASGRTPDDFVAFRAAILPVLRAQVRDLRALEAPEGDGDDVTEIYDAVSAATDRIEQASPEELAQVVTSDPFAEAREKARDYGLQECGKG